MFLSSDILSLYNVSMEKEDFMMRILLKILLFPITIILTVILLICEFICILNP